MTKTKKVINILLITALILSVIGLVYRIGMHRVLIQRNTDYSSELKYYDKNNIKYNTQEDVVYYDEEGNTYTYNFDKTGYDYLYINKSEERLYTDWCYLNSDGYVVYDDDMSVTAKDKNCCIDVDGQIYYPVKYSVFNKDGTIRYVYNQNDFSYDRLGKAYTFRYVPYYDSDGNMYYYYFDSAEQKGFYISMSTGKTYENKYSFVDKNGYFVYDSKHSFVEKKDAEHKGTYVDENKKTYYWASGISWNENGQLMDSVGNII